MVMEFNVFSCNIFQLCGSTMFIMGLSPMVFDSEDEFYSPINKKCKCLLLNIIRGYAFNLIIFIRLRFLINRLRCAETSHGSRSSESVSDHRLSLVSQKIH